MIVGTEERKEDADAQLGSSQAELIKLRLAVEASGEVIFMTDADGTITYVNPEFVRLYGYGPSELIGRSTPRILKGGSVSSEDYSSFWRELRSREVVRREFVNRTKAGVTVQIEGSANPILMNGELVGFLAVQRDVTARKATEAALRESEARYRALAEAAHDSIFIVTSDGRIEYANAVSLERFGLQAGSIGQRLHEVFAPAAADEMWRELSTVFASGARHYFETGFDCPAGEIWLGAWIVPLARDETQPAAVMGVARDITDRKRLEREYAQAQKMEAVGRLAGGIAHDFNNLLTAILGYSEFLVDALRSQPHLAADVNEIKTAGERASRLTRQLLTFSRKQTFSPKVLDLNGVVTELQKMLQRIIGEDVLLDLEAEPQLAPIKVDPGQMEQLIVNLAVNARDAMPRGGSLRIRTANAELDTEFARRHEGAAPGRYVALSVQDSGCGMTADVLAHAFEPFYTTKPEGKGTGLGLSTVYGIVKQSGGYITIDSRPGAGTTVTTYLPVAGEAPSALPGDQDPVKRLTGTETILLVEDEPGLRRLMQRTLQQYGYTVLNSLTPLDAIAVAATHPMPIDLLLSDVVMPGLCGPDLAQRIRRLRPAVKVLYVSGFAGHEVFDGGSVAAKGGLLAKPFTPHALATIVRECLDAAAPPPGMPTGSMKEQ
jgi:two-component system cell cycle sensor histidine kinase/response regulator CckA